MLERAHCARIHVDIRVKLDQGNRQTSCLKKRAKRGGRETFTERRDNASGNEGEFGSGTVGHFSS